MAKIDINILNLFAHYVLPIFIGYIFIFHLSWNLWKPLFRSAKVRMIRYIAYKYWTMIRSDYKDEIGHVFGPIHEIARNKVHQKLRVMEIGIGEGANLSLYPPNCEVFGVDPQARVEEGLRKNIAKHEGLELKSFKPVGAEDMSHIEDNSMDVVVCTLVLCTVKDPPKVLQEVKRILRKVREI